MAERGDMVDADGVVRIGSVVFALIQPTEGHELAFNRWYERDHFYTCGTAAPGVFSGARFIQRTAGTQLALFFVLPDHDARRVGFATHQVGLAAAENRMFTEREHLHTWGYEPVAQWRADPEGVAPALALDHRYAGLTIAMVDGLEPETVVDHLAGGGPDDHDVDVALVLGPLDRIMESSWPGSLDLSSRLTVLAFHRAAPTPGRTGLESLADRSAGFGWVETFVPVVVGTDTHIPS